MDLSLTEELAKVGDVRHQVRHLRWFRASFDRCVRLVSDHWGIAFDVDDERLASAFLDWAETFSAQKQCAEIAPKDFAAFSGGLLLKEFIEKAVARVKPRVEATARGPVDKRFAVIVDFWPEGFLYTSYCLSVLNVVMGQDFDAAFTLDPVAEDLRAWWSFRENTLEDPALAIGFLDAFLGNEPNWQQPAWALARPAMIRMRGMLEDAGR